MRKPLRNRRAAREVTTERAPAEGRTRAKSRQALRRVLFAVLLVDTVLLATLELFFLPLRLDGTVLPKLGDFPIPVTVLVALLTTPLLVSQTGRLVHPRVAFVPLVLWVLTLVVLGLFGPGGDVVLLQDWRGLLLIGGGALPAAMALGGSLATGGMRGKRG